MKNLCRLSLSFSALAFLLIASSPTARSEVILQYFETEWDEIYQRLPELAEIGFEGIWHPSPTKAPVAGVFPNGYGGNVGYNLYDRFDLGDTPQRGTIRTRYGTKGSLLRMVDNAHQTGIKIYPDIVFNHTGNGPHINTYPGMKIDADGGVADFHGWYDSGQPLNFKRTPRMFQWTPDNGCGGTIWQELVSLIDIQLEPDNRFSTANSCGPDNLLPPANYLRHPGREDLYPFHSITNLPDETPIEFMERWINWLGYTMDYDGVRLDAPKHVAREFFGEPNNGFGSPYGFNHQIQWNFDDRRGLNDGSTYDEMYTSDIWGRDDALIFGEMFIFDKSEVDYWRNWNGGSGPDNDRGVKMRYLDFPLVKQMMIPAFNDGNMAALSGFAAFGNEEGMTFVHSHDEDSVFKKELAYAYALTHIGVPIVFFTGNNYDATHRNWKSWMLQGYENALNDWGESPIPNLVYIHNNFARGLEWGRWSDGDVFIYERFENLDNSTDGSGTFTPTAPEGLLLVGLNDSGFDQSRTVAVTFPDGTLLKDYTGNNGTDLTVSGGQVTVTIPGMNGQGFVAYAPYNATADGDPVRFSQGTGSPSEMDWDGSRRSSFTGT